MTSEPDLSTIFPDEDQLQTTVRYGLYPTKTGAGIQEIEIHGDGRVILRRTADAEAEVETREAKTSSMIVVRLLDWMIRSNFKVQEDHYPAEGQILTRQVVTLTAPGYTKEVTIDGEPNEPLTRCIHALVFTAGIAIPEAFGLRFFRNI
jgi:hypothetical protein